MSADDEEIVRLRAENARLKAELGQAPEPPPAPVARDPAPLAAQAPSGAPRHSYLIAGIAVATIGAILYALMSSQPRAGADAAPPDPIAAAAASAPAPKDWAYLNSTDELRGQAVKQACLTSANQVQLGYPYGPTHVRLCIRRGGIGDAAYLTLVGDGQFVCRSYDRCAVQVKVDGGQPSAYSMNEAADYSSDVIFFQNRKRLEDAVAKARRIIVEAQFYDAGQQQMVFETDLDLAM